MPQSLSIVSHISYPKNSLKKRKRSLRRTNRVSVISFALIFLILGCFSFYLYINLQLVEMNFALREKEKKLNTLENDIKQLESRIGNSLSIEELEKKVQELKLTKVNNVKYLKLKTSPTLSLEE